MSGDEKEDAKDVGTQSSATALRWCVATSEGASTPLSIEHLAYYFKSGSIDGLTPVWCEGMTGWVPLSQVPEIKQSLTHLDDAVSDEAEATPTPVVDGPKEEQINEAKDADQEEHEEQDKDKQRKAQNALKRQQYRERLKAKKKLGISKIQRNPNVYVTGLPLRNIDENMLAEEFKRGGVIQVAPDTMKPKIRLYRNADGTLKGDALISYVHEQSVDLAIKYLDGIQLEGNKIQVQKATFEPPPSVSTSELRKRLAELPPEDLNARRRKQAAKNEQNRLLSWGDGIQESKKTKKALLCVRNLWSREIAMLLGTTSPLYELLSKELARGLREKWGEKSVRKVTPICGHPLGVVVVRMESFAAAEAIKTAFSPTGDEVAATEAQQWAVPGHQLQVYFYDGETDLQSQVVVNKTGYLNDDSKKVKVVQVVRAAQPQGLEAMQRSVVATLMEHLADLQEMMDMHGGEIPNPDISKESTTEIRSEKDEKKLDVFGDWLDQQSSDEELEVVVEE